MGTKREVMCATCGFETTATSEDAADRKHLQFDPAHEPNWYEDDERVKTW